MFFRSAVAEIKGSSQARKLYGLVSFYQRKNYVLIVADIKGLPPSQSGFFGFHIHEGNSCTGENFADTLSHYNPKNTPHPSHAGDLPSLLKCNGGAYLSVKTDRFNVSDIIGKTVVIHSLPDDFTSQPAGNAGTKIACGIIEKV